MRKSLKTFLTNHKNVRVIGLTATPFHPDIGKHFTSVTNVVTMKQLVDEGFLVPFRVFVAKEIDMTGVKVVAGEWQKDETEKRSLSIVGDVVADYVRISQEVFGGPRKTICFSAGVAHGESLVQKFQEHGINAVQISYKDSEEYKTEVLEEFAKPDTDIQIVISSDILTRGFDQTDVEHVIIAKPLRKAFSMHVQMVGRGARPHPGKTFCCIQDHANNWLRFADDWDNIYENGTKELDSDQDTKTRKEKTKDEKEASKCPKCSALWPKGSDTCTNCGHTRQRRSLMEEMPGVIEELAARAKKDDKQAFWAMCQYKVQIEGWNPGRAAHLYKDKFGVWPRGLVDKPAMPDATFEKFVKSRLIAYLKGKKRGVIAA
jgi:DNA repair protein RadD